MVDYKSSMKWYYLFIFSFASYLFLFSFLKLFSWSKKTETYNSAEMYSILLRTLAFASAKSCFTRTGPINLNTLASSFNKSSSYKCPRKKKLSINCKDQQKCSWIVHDILQLLCSRGREVLGKTRTILWVSWSYDASLSS